MITHTLEDLSYVDFLTKEETTNLERHLFKGWDDEEIERTEYVVNKLIQEAYSRGYLDRDAEGANV